MQVHAYTTMGGKNEIFIYLDSLETRERAEGYAIISNLEEQGSKFLDTLDTRQLKGKIWEIKFYRHNRIMYILVDQDNIFLLHACKKQKNKAEKKNIEIAMKRAKEIPPTVSAK